MLQRLWRCPSRVLALGLAAAAPPAALGCATCGCTLSADGAMGYAVGEGWRLNFEYDYIDQDELRRGTHGATPEQIINQPSSPELGGGEIEHQTLNRYFTLGLGYSPNEDWNIDVRVPYVVRPHSTYGVQLQPFEPSETAPDQLSSVRVSGLGDVRLIASYQGLLSMHNLGLQLGVKLPTGSYGTAVKFSSGPNAGTPLDASLQAGTGSTDVIVGAYFYRPVSRNFSAYINAQFQAALLEKQNQPGDDFRPGNTSTLSLGVRYQANPKWVPQLQINLSDKQRDRGALADLPDTAGSVGYLSPGITVELVSGVHLYAFVQLPFYSNLIGYQLFPRWTASLGANYVL
ncbi:MAG: transporter [Steroidobacteraceae bacterium]